MKKIPMTVAALAVGSLFAATCTWSGAGDGTTWSDGANWGGTAPAAGDTATFNGNVTFNGDVVLPGNLLLFFAGSFFREARATSLVGKTRLLHSAGDVRHLPFSGGGDKFFVLKDGPF